MTVLLLQADARHLPLADGSVHCLVTSPPYWSLRDYGLAPTAWGGVPAHTHAWEPYARQDERYTGKTKWQHIGAEAQATGVKVRDVDPNAWGHPQIETEAFCDCGAWLGCLGLEPTPGEYTAHMVEVFRAWRRVLRDDGVIWLNLGDSSIASGGLGTGGNFARINRQYQQRNQRPGREVAGLLPGNAALIPHRVAMALQEDGWIVRTDVTWSKPNPMPESVAGWRWQRHQVKNGACTGCPACARNDGLVLRRGSWRPARSKETLFLITKPGPYYSDGEPVRERGVGSVYRNLRDVWTIATAPYAGAHFATFPPALVRPCVLSGTPPKVCAACGAPWAPIVDVACENPGARTAGWLPTCRCEAGSRPALVLDPFGGTGTVAQVAHEAGRDAVIIDMSREYLDLARNRLALAMVRVVDAGPTERQMRKVGTEQKALL